MGSHAQRGWAAGVTAPRELVPQGRGQAVATGALLQALGTEWLEAAARPRSQRVGG